MIYIGVPQQRILTTPCIRLNLAAQVNPCPPTRGHEHVDAGALTAGRITPGKVSRRVTVPQMFACRSHKVRSALRDNRTGEEEKTQSALHA